MNAYYRLSDKQATVFESLPAKYGMRCLFGIHEKITYLSPINHPEKTSIRLTCSRCKALLDIELLSYSYNYQPQPRS